MTEISSIPIRANVESLIDRLSSRDTSSLMEELAILKEDSYERLQSDGSALLTYLFCHAIGEHFSEVIVKNEHLYLAQFEIPQIKLFDILINKFPFVKIAHTLVNGHIAHLTGESSSVAVIDFGIGRGLQMASLIRSLAGHDHLSELTIIGVEVSTEAIAFAKKLLNEVATSVPFKVNILITEGFAEDFDIDCMKHLLGDQYEKVIVNASLTLHHIQSVASRKLFFEKIQQLSPDALLLIEPHSDHMTCDWPVRVRNAWFHYGAIFDAVDQLDISQEEKAGVKMFFGREIRDVVGLPESDRVERHELLQNWGDYCTSIGMVPGNDIRVSEEGIIGIRQVEEGLMMSYNDVDVLALISFVGA